MYKLKLFAERNCLYRADLAAFTAGNAFAVAYMTAIHLAMLHTEVAVDALDVVNLHAKEGDFIKQSVNSA